MGLLKSIGKIGGGIVGSLVPGVGTAAGAALGGALGGAIDGGKKGSPGQNRDPAAAQAALDKGYGQIRDIQGPYVQGGYAGWNALTNRLGLPAEGVAAATATATGQAAPASAATPAPAPTPGPVSPTYGGAGPYQAPGAPAAYQSPQDFAYGLDDYQSSPGYQWQLDQAQKAILASNSATGALRSGATLKALQDRAQQMAYQDFNNERDFAFGAYRDDRNFDYGVSRDQRADYQDDRNFSRSVYADDRDFNRGVYVDDRNYGAGRYDRQTDDLFQYTGMGQQAAGVVSGAAGANAQTMAGIYGSGPTAASASDPWAGVADGVVDLLPSLLKTKTAAKPAPAADQWSPYDQGRVTI